MDLAAVCETAALLCENEVCNKVADVVAAADGDDNFLSSVVYGSIAGDACSPATIERLLDVYFRNMFFFGGRIQVIPESVNDCCSVALYVVTFSRACD